MTTQIKAASPASHATFTSVGCRCRRDLVTCTSTLPDRRTYCSRRHRVHRRPSVRHRTNDSVDDDPRHFQSQTERPSESDSDDSTKSAQENHVQSHITHRVATRHSGRATNDVTMSRNRLCLDVAATADQRPNLPASRALVAVSANYRTPTMLVFTPHASRFKDDRTVHIQIYHWSNAPIIRPKCA